MYIDNNFLYCIGHDIFYTIPNFKYFTTIFPIFQDLYEKYKI